MLEIPFLLQVCLTHGECVQYPRNEFLPAWLVIPRGAGEGVGREEIKGVEDADEAMFLYLVY